MKKILVYLVSLVLLTSCVDEVEHDNTPTGNFEALWEIMDEHYCFFSYKQIDWQAVYNKYKVTVRLGWALQRMRRSILLKSA